MENQNKRIFRKTGRVLEALPSTHFRVLLDDGNEILAHLAGKLRIYKIKILVSEVLIDDK